MTKIKFKFKPDAQVNSDDPHYDLFVGGYIKPENLLVNEGQIRMVNDAIKVISAFMNQAEEKDVLLIN